MMNDYTIYAMKVNDEWSDSISTSLKNGEGRFGWSYIKDADLHQLKSKIENKGWNTLSEDEKKCYQSFLLEVEPDDYVIYINVPEWGKCTLARTTGHYVWRFEDDDFNHRFPVDPTSVVVFDRNDAIVHPALSSRLKLQGRFWRIYVKEEFEALITKIKEGEGGTQRTAKTNATFLSEELKPLLKKITEKIHHTHPNYDLEGLVAETLKKVPGVKEVKLLGGAGDHGADIIITFETGLPISGFQEQKTCVVQVKSFEGEHWDTQAIADIKRAFNYYPEAEMGLIVSTASSSSTLFDEELEKLREKTGKPVSLLIGQDVATFLLRFGSQIFT